jgi:mannose-6-phosphate isomerase-like protein (cupin superfamily)
VVQPGAGLEGSLGTIGVQFKIDGAQTAGLVSIVEHPFPVGSLVPLHLHTREDEYSIVLEGEIGFRSEDSEVVLGPGGYIMKPRNEMHTMWNAGSVPARMIEVIQPAGFENFFHGLVDIVDAGMPHPEEMGSLADKHGLVLGDQSKLADLIERFNLTPPPGA